MTEPQPGPPRFIDGDAHVLETLDLWQRLPKKFQKRVDIQFPSDHPYYRDKLFDVFLDGHPISTWRGERKQRILRLVERFEKKLPRGAGFEPDQVLRDFDVEGLEAAALYPTWCLMAAWIPGVGADLAGAIAASYNDYLHDFCSVDRRRLRPVILVALHDVSAAVREIERNAERGFVGVFVRPNPLYGRTLGHPDYAPLYEVLEKLELPLGIHEGTNSHLPTAGIDRTTTQAGHHIVCHPLEQMLAFVSMHEAGVFDRFPRLKVLFLECGTLWAPYWLERVDAERSGYRSDHTGRFAADVFREQCFLTAEVDDRFLPTTISLLGDDNILLSTDYPHDESRYPRSQQLFLEQPIPDASREKIGRQNALRAYPRFNAF